MNKTFIGTKEQFYGITIKTLKDALDEGNLTQVSA